MELVLPMYNAHPYISLKNLGKNVHITHGKIWYLPHHFYPWTVYKFFKIEDKSFFLQETFQIPPIFKQVLFYFFQFNSVFTFI